MSYYIDSLIGKIYFNSHQKLYAVISQTENLIHRRNISFMDENQFYIFSDLYKWVSMNIVKTNEKYYLRINLENNTYEILNIYHDYLTEL
jgi:hypothetical protein